MKLQGAILVAGLVLTVAGSSDAQIRSTGPEDNGLDRPDSKPPRLRSALDQRRKEKEGWWQDAHKASNVDRLEGWPMTIILELLVEGQRLTALPDVPLPGSVNCYLAFTLPKGKKGVGYCFALELSIPPALAGDEDSEDVARLQVVYAEALQAIKGPRRQAASAQLREISTLYTAIKKRHQKRTNLKPDPDIAGIRFLRHFGEYQLVLKHPRAHVLLRPVPRFRSVAELAVFMHREGVCLAPTGGEKKAEEAYCKLYTLVLEFERALKRRASR
jgi:hypothetical protein